jgi:hypothetical protein
MALPNAAAKIVDEVDKALYPKKQRIL